MNYKYALIGHQEVIRTSKNNNYKFAVETDYRGNKKYSCHETLELAQKTRNSILSEFDRHPQDFNADYNPHECTKILTLWIVNI